MLVPIWIWLGGVLSWAVAAAFDYWPRKSQFDAHQEAVSMDAAYASFIKSQPKPSPVWSDEPSIWTSVRLVSSPTLLVTVLTSLVTLFGTPGVHTGTLLVIWVVLLVIVLVVAILGVLDKRSAPKFTRWQVGVGLWGVTLVVVSCIAYFNPATTTVTPSPCCTPCASTPSATTSAAPSASTSGDRGKG